VLIESSSLRLSSKQFIERANFISIASIRGCFVSGFRTLTTVHERDRDLSSRLRSFLTLFRQVDDFNLDHHQQISRQDPGNHAPWAEPNAPAE
jgi:hypothetical protein